MNNERRILNDEVEESRLMFIVRDLHFIIRYS